MDTVSLTAGQDSTRWQLVMLNTGAVKDCVFGCKSLVSMAINASSATHRGMFNITVCQTEDSCVSKSGGGKCHKSC